MSTTPPIVPDGPTPTSTRLTFFHRLRAFRLPDRLLHHAYPVVLALVLFTLLAPMLRDGMWKGHDGSSHILRLHSTISALSEGQFPPVINSAQENAFGYSWNLFYPPLSIYLATGVTLGLQKLGVATLFAGLKLTWLIIILASAGSMFFFLNYVFRSRFAAAMGTVLYVTAPYFVSCVYIRFALGEIMMFVFLPLLAAALYSIFYEQGEKNYLLTIGTVGILLSNIPASIILLLCLIVFTMFHFRSLWNARILRQLAANIVLTTGITAFFYAPLFEQWSYGNIVAFLNMTGASLESLQNEGVKFWWLFVPKKLVRMFFYYGYPMLFCGVWLFFKTPQKKWTKIIAVLCLLLSFAMSKWMPWPYLTPPFLDFVKYMQFPWRMLGVAIFLLTTLAAYNSECFFSKEGRPQALLVTTILCVITTIFVLPSGRYDTIERPETHTADYLPNKSLPFKKQFASMKAVPVVLSGEAILKNIKKTGSKLSFSIDREPEASVVEMPYFAYLGYSAHLAASNREAKESLPLQESDKGLWSTIIPANTSGTVTMEYTGTKISRAGYRISQGAIVLFICYVLFSILQKRRENCT